MRLWPAVVLLAACPQDIVIDDRDALPRRDVAEAPDAGPAPMGWKAYDVQLTDRLNAIHGTGPDDVWAVGERGIVLHFDGSAWSRITIATLEELNDVFAIAPGEVWVVGDNGALLHLRGGQWTPHADAVPEGIGGGKPDLVSVAATGADDVWIAPEGPIDVGQVTSEHAALHYSMGGQWTVVRRPDPGSYEVAIALRGTLGAFLHDNDLQLRGGNEWVNVEPPVRASLLSFVDVAIDVSSRVWIVADQITPSRARVFRFAGGSWSELDGPGLVNELLTTELTAISADQGDEAWAVGEFAQLSHFDGARWNVAIQPRIGGPKLRDLFVTGSRIYAVGSSGTVLCANCP